MRTAVIATAAFCTLVGLASAKDANAAIRQSTEIAPQPLGEALNELARGRKLQVLYFSSTVRGLNTQGASGELTTDEAFDRLLAGTGLAHKFIDDATVSVFPVPPVAPAPPTGGVRSESTAQTTSAPASEGGQKESFWGRFRVAQATDRSVAAVNADELAPSDRAQVEEVVVTAQKRKERLQEVPISISVLNGSDLDKSTAQSINEMLNRVPGVVAATPGVYGGSQVAVRGVAAGGTILNSAGPVSYYLDSIPFGFVRHAYAPDANAYDLERVEVLRGPQGTLYGANAAAGVVRVLTHDADLSRFDLKARTSVASTEDGDGSYRADAAVNVPIIEDKLAVRAVVGYGSLGGWIDRPNDANANDATLRTYRIKIAAQPTEAFSVGLLAWKSRDRFGAPSTADDNGKSAQTIPERQSNDFDAYGVTLGYELDSFSLSSRSSYIDYDKSFVVDLSPFGAPVPLPAQVTSRVWSQELLATSTGTGPWAWSVGASYRDARDHFYQIVGDFVASTISFTDGSKSYAAFGEVSRKFMDDRFKWTLGLRSFHDKVSTVKDVPTPPPSALEDSFTSTTPRAVLSYFPSSHLSLYGSYSEGFRSGMPQYYAASLSDPTLPPLKPDKLHNYELGGKGELFGGGLSFDAAVYYVDWKDVQQVINVPDPSGTGGVIAAQVNGKSASGLGLEFSLVTRPADGLSLGIGYGWSDLSFDEAVISGGGVLFNKGDRLNGSSEHTGTAFADYDFPLGSMTGKLSVSANYASKQTNRSPGVVIEGDDLLIARASFSLSAAEHWSAMLYGDNLTNEDGALPGEVLVADWYPRPRPRTFGLQLDYRFN